MLEEEKPIIHLSAKQSPKYSCYTKSNQKATPFSCSLVFVAIYRFLDEHEKVDTEMAKSHKLWVKPSPADWFSDVIKAVHNGASP